MSVSCKRCLIVVKEGESLTLSGLCRACYCETTEVRESVCICCGERPRQKCSPHCLDCKLDSGVCFGSYDDCDDCGECELKDICKKYTEESDDT